MLPASKNISLIGFMGTGKSSIGKALGRKSGRAVVDIDLWIEAAQKRKIREIFEKDGEARFRELENQAIDQVAKSQKGVVITTGGGAVLDPANLRALKESGWVVSLSASPETIFERVKDSRHRPLLKGGDLRSEIHRLLEIRKPFYATADFEFKTDGLTPDQVAQVILEALEHEA